MKTLQNLLVCAIILSVTIICEGKGLRPENPKTLARPIAVYPSAKLPPISQPMFFGFYNMPCTRKKQEMVHKWIPHWNLLTNVRGSRKQSIETIEYCLKHGILPLNWIQGPMRPKWNRQSDWIYYYLSAARNKNLIGIGVDEWQPNGVAAYGGTKIVNFAAEGLKWAKQEHPNFYQMVFWRGEDNIISKLVKHRYIDLLIVEGYSYVWMRDDWSIQPPGTLKRVELARKWGAIERMIVMLGQLTNVKCKTNPKLKPPGGKEFEQQIQYFRKHAPEMPGISFYIAANTFKELKEKFQACDRLFVKYYLKPAPTVKILNPAPKAIVSGLCKISAAAKPKQADAKIIKYLWFVDNRLMAKTKGPQWIWNTRLELPGEHIITVQAVDSSYNRGAVQCTVTVK